MADTVFPEPLDTSGDEVKIPAYPGWDIPRDKTYPPDAVQCDYCGGWGCEYCGDKGWVPPGSPCGRKCRRNDCNNPIPPAQVAVYCSTECAIADAYF